MSKPKLNSPCCCGSGKKYKNCCLSKDKRADRDAAKAKKSTARTEPEANARLETAAAEPEDWAEPTEETEEDTGGASRRSHRLPRLSKEDAAVVDEWWREFMPFYRRRDVEKMLRRIEGFMDSHPALYVHLGLDEECLFELGGEMHRQGRHARYCELLERVRREQPAAFALSYGFHEEELIVELLVTDRRTDVPEHFRYFKADPDSSPDELAHVVNILLATNCEAELFELARAVAVPVAESRHVIRGAFMLEWLTFQPVAAALDRRDLSQAAMSRLRADFAALPFGVDPETAEDDVRNTLAEAPPGAWAGKADYKQYCLRISQHFTAWLHDRMGLTWSASRHFATQVGNYLLNTKPNKGKSPFDFDYDSLDHFAADSYRDMFWIDGVSALTLAQAGWWFSRYLLDHGMVDEAASAKLRETSQRLAKAVRQTAAASDPGPRIFEDLSRYRWAARNSPWPGRAGRSS
jgi:hypothetical protein